MSTALWTGDFGAAYLERNKNAGELRWPFWRRIQQQFPMVFQSTLEIGTGSGNNLMWLVNKRAGVDVNEQALAVARDRCPTADLRVADVRALPYPDNSFTCVFSCGVLIHQSPEDLPKVMDEMFRVSSYGLLVMEYHSNTEVEVEYRGQKKALWTRPYGTLFPQRFALERLACGVLKKDQGFDKVTFDLWAKR